MENRTHAVRWFVIAVVASLLVATACSDDESSSGGSGGATSTPQESVTTVPRPTGPVADLSEELTGGKGVFIGSPDAFDDQGNYQVEVNAPGYVQEEFVASGTATSFVPVGELSADGRWTLNEGQQADYRTRVLVRRPENPDDFSGVVVVEWLNVSGGADADPGYTSLRDEIVREGHAYVGVSAQALGIEGGDVLVRVNVPGGESAGLGMKAIDPARYGSLQHPGDAFSYDIYTQVARALREGQAMGDLQPEHLIASGQSQSAAALVSYINGVQPMTQAFDGFFVHSRGGAGLPFPAVGESIDIASAIGRPGSILRTDTRVPIVDLQAENDVVGVLGSLEARQPDSETFRLWEVAGTAHADRTLVGGDTADLIDCGVPINGAPMYLVVRAAMHQLVDWVVSGEPPPQAPRLEVSEGDDPEIQRNEDAIALGGVRTPPVDVPIEVFSGESGPGGDAICILSGSTTPLSPDRIAARYPSRDAYEQAYREAVDEVIEAGFVLEADRAAIEDYARPELVSG